MGITDKELDNILTQYNNPNRGKFYALLVSWMRQLRKPNISKEKKKIIARNVLLLHKIMIKVLSKSKGKESLNAIYDSFREKSQYFYNEGLVSIKMLNLRYFDDTNNFYSDIRKVINEILEKTQDDGTERFDHINRYVSSKVEFLGDLRNERKLIFENTFTHANVSDLYRILKKKDISKKDRKL